MPTKFFRLLSVQRLMVRSTERHCELIADLAAQCSWLANFRWCASAGLFWADKALLAADEGEVFLASTPGRLLRRGKADMCLEEGIDRCIDSRGLGDLRWIATWGRELISALKVGRGVMLQSELEGPGVPFQEGVLGRQACFRPG